MTEKLTLPDHPWGIRYSSGTHDLVEDFFIPALSRSRFYYRIAAFFSSTSLAVAARGISAFVDRGEKMYLIVGGQLSSEDVMAIEKGLKNLDEVLHKKWEECKADFDNNLIKKRFELLAWLIANDKLEIKIGINKDENGRYLPFHRSLFHEKVLIFEDHEGNMIQLDGSINETGQAWKSNRESFCVHRSWVEGEGKFIESAKSSFNNIWNNNDERSVVMDLPTAIEKELIELRPERPPGTHEELELDDPIQPVEIEVRSLRNYQEEAIDAWIKNGHIGILEMATGTGKTFTALSAIKMLELSSKVLLISVPQKELANQWMEECEKAFQGNDIDILPCHGETGWKKDISRVLRESKDSGRLCILIVVLNTLRSNLFLSKIKKYLKDTYLIIDEVHEVGSTENRKVLLKLEDVRYRLGLSATPERMWDDEGNEAINKYFHGDPVFVWDMKMAIKPPNGYDPCLAEYEYHLHNCSLNSEELERYEELSEKIKRLLAIKTKGGKVGFKDIKEDSSLTKLLNRRADIIKECDSKLEVLETILNDHSASLNKCLVYCNDKEHMEKITHSITGKGFNCLKFYGDLDTDIREAIFDQFKNGSVQFLVAIKCLDQGIDIPICDSAIILTSSHNPREYIQRRGRVLRLHPGKDFAVIHDILVLPYPQDDLIHGRQKISAQEATMIDNQLDRIKIFMQNARNSAQNLLKRIKLGKILTYAREDI